MATEAQWEYLRRARDLVELGSEFLPARDLDEARRLIKHGEPTEGLNSLAWAIVGGDTLVPLRLIAELRILTGETEVVEYLPPNLNDFVLQDS